MSELGKFISSVKPYVKVNEEILRMREEPIERYIVKCFKILESSYVKMIKWELITDESKFDADAVNVKHIKNKKNRKFTKRLSTNRSRYNMLRMWFRLRSDEKEFPEAIEVVDILLFKTGKNGCFLKDGKSYYPLFQMVDTSVYNTTDNTTLKSLLMPVVTNQTNKYLTTLENESVYVPVYRLLLFKKKTNPLKYFAAGLGLENTIKFIQMEDIIRVHNKQKYDPRKEYAFDIGNGFYLYCIKYFFDNDFFTRGCVEMLIDLISSVKSVFELNSNKFWVVELGKEFLFRASQSDPVKLFTKGKELTFSFQRLIDDITIDQLDLDYENKASVYNIIRWILRNYNALRERDNMSLEHKRLRVSEYLAAYLIKDLNKKMTSFTQMRANNKPITMASVQVLVRTKPKELISACLSSKSPLLRIDNSTNSADFFNNFKYTTKGPQAITKSDSIKDSLRGLHPSFLGRVDLTAISSSDPGLTRALTFNCPIKNKKFSDKAEPQEWTENFARLYSNYFNGTKLKIQNFDFYHLDDKDRERRMLHYKQCTHTHISQDPYFKHRFVDFESSDLDVKTVKIKKKEDKEKRVYKFKIKK